MLSNHGYAVQSLVSPCGVLHYYNKSFLVEFLVVLASINNKASIITACYFGFRVQFRAPKN